MHSGYFFSLFIMPKLNWNINMLTKDNDVFGFGYVLRTLVQLHVVPDSSLIIKRKATFNQKDLNATI